MNLLIVDDNAEVRRVIRSIVADLAVGIHECADGAEAVEACDQGQPDWVLMDIEMDPMDGLSATRAIRVSWPDVRICIVTHYDDQELRVAASQAGACAYVVKDDLLSLRGVLRDAVAGGEEPCENERDTLQRSREDP